MSRKKTKNSIELKCKKCGSGFCAFPSDIKNGREYCSKPCANSVRAETYSTIANKSGEDNPNWKGGISKDNYHYKKVQKERHPEKVKAREILSYHVRQGKMVRQPCVVCGEVKSHGHHKDYTKPLEVVWLCKIHHDEAHAV